MSYCQLGLIERPTGKEIHLPALGKRRLVFLLSITRFLLFLFEGVPLPLGAWERCCCFIVTLPGPSIELFSIRSQNGETVILKHFTYLYKKSNIYINEKAFLKR